MKNNYFGHNKILKSYNFELKYFFNSLRVILRSVFRSYAIWISLILSLLASFLLLALLTSTTLTLVDKFFAKNSSNLTYTYEEQIWIYENQMFLIFGLSSLLTSSLMVIPILLILNRIFLNLIRSGQFLVYLSTPISKSTSIFSIIVFTIFTIFLYVVINSVGRIGITTTILKNAILDNPHISQDALNAITFHQWNSVPSSIGYMMLLGILMALAIIVIGINTTPLATNLAVSFIFVITGLLYLGVQVALARISSIRENSTWVFKIIAILFVGSYPIFIVLHGYIHGGYIDLLSKINGTKLSNFGKSFKEPFMNDMPKNATGNIKDSLYIREYELIIILVISIIVLFIALVIIWRKKRIV